jgi:hypothetical protein
VGEILGDSLSKQLTVGSQLVALNPVSSVQLRRFYGAFTRSLKRTFADFTMSSDWNSV